MRYHSLDAVRAFALLLGIGFHAAESFESNAITYWAIGDNSHSQILHLFRHASHSFRLELFFLIAGFFAHFLLMKRRIGNFIKNRLSRILAPLMIGWAVLFPIIVFIWLTGIAKASNWDMLGIPEEYRNTPPVYCKR